MPSSTYVYNCLPHTSTASAPFELVLSRPSPPSALKAFPKEYSAPQGAKNKCKRWLAKSLGKVSARLNKAQKRYKRNFDAKLCKQREKIEKGDYVYFGVERPDGNRHRHKLAAVAAEPYLVLDVERKTVALEREDKAVDRVSRNRVTHAPTPRTKEKLQRVVRPMIVEDLRPSTYSTSEQFNIRNLTPPESLPDPNSFGHITRSRANMIRKAQTADTESSVTPDLLPRDAQAETTQENVID